MPRFDKWIQGISTDDNVGQAARISLAARLAAVEYYLPRAAECYDEDVEYVHQLRVSARRATSALELYEKVVPKKDCVWLRKILRKTRRAAGAARDLDVITLNHRSDTGKGARRFLSSIERRRVLAHEPIVKIYRKLDRKSRFQRRSRSIIEKAGSCDSDSAREEFGRFAAMRMNDLFARLFEARPRDTHDLDALHRFRIRGKTVRYAMELLAPAFPAAFREDLYPKIEEVQERLGKIHDSAVAGARFARRLRRKTGKKEAKHLRRLLNDEHEILDRLLTEFAAWWTPAFVDDLRQAFAACIHETSLQHNYR